ncbi:tyrosine-type recombinase/integrase [Tannockella kyphosi]|uniref:tyrosine-type recombinase/integrase n=1 Tax=Tannockella kyphosi TaxID=2899121 RepID=UPI00201229DA|nr:tyrosine-type recombinase/integrase [Tannockella kyphosi]
MTHEEALKKLETDIQLRGMSPHTMLEYQTKARKFLQHFNKPIEELCENDFRIYLEYLDKEANIQPSTMNVYNSALRFFFEVTLEQTLCYRRLPRKKDPIKVPVAFTRQEVLWFLEAIDDSTRYKAIFSLTYGCGLRLSEVRHLRIKDIDKQQMRLFVYQGKGQRDRWVPLSKFAYDDLCTYYLEYKPKHPDGYLFLNGINGCGDAPISERAIQDAFKRYHIRGRIPTYGTVHTLRHSYATHLMEDGVNVFYIQKILGHATLWTTMRYLRISMTDVMKTKSPLDKLMEKETKRKSKGNK